MKDMLSTLIKNGNITKGDIVSTLFEQMEVENMSNDVKLPKVCYRKDRGEYFLTVPVKFSKTGKRYPVYGETEEKAIENFKLEISLFNNGITFEEGNNHTIPTLKAMIILESKKYIYYEVEETTYLKYENVYEVHIFKDPISYKQIDEISIADINAFLKKDEISKLSRSSLNAIGGILKRVFLRAKQLHYISENPMEFVKISYKSCKAPKKTKQCLKGDEISKISRYIEYTSTNLSNRYRMGPIFMVMLYTGIRIGEALALKESDIDRKNGYIYIRKQMSYVPKRDSHLNRLPGGSQKEKSPKTLNSCREILLTKQALYWIDKMIEMNHNFDKYPEDCEYLFVGKSGKVPVKETVMRFWRDTLKNLDIPYCTTHKLRKTYITTLINSGVPIVDVCSQVGHKNKTVTLNTYYSSIYDDTNKNILVDNIEQAFDNTKNQGISVDNSLTTDNASHLRGLIA